MTDITAICGKAPLWLKESFLNFGITLTEIGCCGSLQTPVAHHIDMMALPMCDKVVLTPETAFLKVYFPGKEPVIVKNHLLPEYPFDVLLNAQVLSNHLICNTNTIASEVKEIAYEQGKSIIHVNQGYTSCSVCTVSDNAIITEDKSVYEACKNEFHVLLITKGEVELLGYDCGFIGGASVTVDDTIYFFGNIEAHPDYEKISSFVSLYNKKAVSLSKDKKLSDIGSIIII